MVKIIGVSGSLRKGSLNTALLRAASALMPDDSELVVKTLHGIPLYDGDEEDAHGLPPAVAALKDSILAADGLLLVTPEYNNSIPGVFKNGIDWLSRADDSDEVFGMKPVAVIGASPGPFGTLLSQTAWLPVLRTLGTLPWWGERLLVSRARTVFDASGALTDPAIKEKLRKFLAGFVGFVGKQKALKA
jgi:NAD(P)H-dependent FMN reductase